MAAPDPAPAPIATPDDGAIQRRIARLLARVPLIDGHNDLAWALNEKFGAEALTVDLRRDLKSASPSLHTDIPRLRAGRLGGQFWSAWIPADLRGGAAIAATLEQIDRIRELVRRYPDTFALASTAEQIRSIHHDGRIASLIGIEGGDQLGGSLAALRLYQALGARYVTLTHARSNDVADSASDVPLHHGLSDFGTAVIHEMNRLGMMVDLSHVSADTMRAAIKVSRAPVIFSHSAARGVNDHGRNVPDDVLLSLKDRDGIVMVAFVASYVSDDYRRWRADRAAERARLVGAPYDGLYLDHGDAGERAFAAWEAAHSAPRVTLAQVADHIDYIRRAIGADHVGLGSDFDGTLVLPTGLDGVETYPRLLAELARRGWSDRELAGLAGENLLRVMAKAEATSRAMRDEPAGTATPSAAAKPAGH